MVVNGWSAEPEAPTLLSPPFIKHQCTRHCRYVASRYGWRFVAAQYTSLPLSCLTFASSSCCCFFCRRSSSNDRGCGQRSERRRSRRGSVHSRLSASGTRHPQRSTPLPPCVCPAPHLLGTVGASLLGRHSRGGRRFPGRAVRPQGRRRGQRPVATAVPAAAAAPTPAAVPAAAAPAVSSVISPAVALAAVVPAVVDKMPASVAVPAVAAAPVPALAAHRPVPPVLWTVRTVTAARARALARVRGTTHEVINALHSRIRKGGRAVNLVECNQTCVLLYHTCIK